MKQIIKTIVKSLTLSLPISFTRNQKYDKQSLEIIKKVLLPNSNCVDVGCHKGEVLSFMLKYAHEGTHFGFEPLPHFYQYLVSQFPNNCKIFQLALNDTQSEVSFNYVETNPAYSGFKKRKYDREDEKVSLIKVKTDLLDNIIPSEVKIDLIKIDVEGAEWQVLKGAVSTIKRCQPVIIFEHGLGAADCYNTTPESIYELLHDECNLRISLMEDWLKGKRTLTKDEFVEQFEKGINYYFVAAPNT